jgi:hypothetical protein
MTSIKTFALALVLMSVYFSAAAGSSRGLHIVVVATPAGIAYLPAVRSFFEQYNVDDGKSDCDGAQLNVDSVIMGKRAARISSDLTVSAVSDKHKRKRLTALLASYYGKPADGGVDGVLIVDSRAGELWLYGIPALLGTAVQRARFRSGDLADEPKLNRAVCHALIHMPVMEAP